MKKILKNIQLLDILNKFKVIVKTQKMLKTTILGFIIAILSKLGIYNKATKPILDKFGEWTAYLYRFWMLFNFFLALYFIGMIGPWEVITYIKNMFNSITEFYINLSQSFIDYIKHIFGGAPEAATKGGRSHTSHTASGGGATESIRIPLPETSDDGGATSRAEPPRQLKLKAAEPQPVSQPHKHLWITIVILVLWLRRLRPTVKNSK